MHIQGEQLLAKQKIFLMGHRGIAGYHFLEGGDAIIKVKTEELKIYSTFFMNSWNKKLL